MRFRSRVGLLGTLGLSVLTVALAPLFAEEEKPCCDEAAKQLAVEQYTQRAKSTVTPVKLEVKEQSWSSAALQGNTALRATLAESTKFQQLESGLPKVEIDGEAFYIAEGDRLLDEDQLLFFADARAEQEKRFNARKRAVFTPKLVADVSSRPSGLVGIVTADEKLVRWGPEVVLRYCVLKGTFPTTDEYEAVRDNMLLATSGWEEICGVDFLYESSLDTSPGVDIPSGVVFAVRYIDAGGQFIAAAFFPTDPPYRRKVLIDPSYFATSFDAVGVLRHELGHVVGFRHEHIRSEAPAVCPNEDTGFTHDLTNYDPQSVMHYLCGGEGSPLLDFTPLDRVGAQSLYGPPLDGFRFVGVE